VNRENLQKLVSKICVALGIILLLSVPVVALPVWANEADVARAISSAKSTMLSCYSAAKEAEAAGANITAIVGTLNEAGSLLSHAELAYSAGDFDAALSFAVQSQNTLNSFIEEANALKETGTQQQITDFLINVVGSILGAFAVLAAGFVVWLFLKKKYVPAEAHNK
jgi:hypothetical protein